MRNIFMKASLAAGSVVGAVSMTARADEYVHNLNGPEIIYEMHTIDERGRHKIVDVPVDFDSLSPEGKMRYAFMAQFDLDTSKYLFLKTDPDAERHSEIFTLIRPKRGFEIMTDKQADHFARFVQHNIEMGYINEDEFLNFVRNDINTYKGVGTRMRMLAALADVNYSLYPETEGKRILELLNHLAQLHMTEEQHKKFVEDVKEMAADGKQLIAPSP